MEREKELDNVTNNQSKTALKWTGYIFWLVVTIIPIAGLIISLVSPVQFYAEQNQWREFVQQFGFYSPLIFILIQAVQVIITPLNHYSVGFMGGFLYGTWLGALYNYIGRILGHIIAFFIARLLGRPLVKRFVSQKTIDKYDKYVSNKSLILFLFYFLPLFPDDEISYLSGLSKMKTKWFVLANVFGHVGGSLSLAYLGSGISSKDPLFWILNIVTLLGFPILWYLFRKNRKTIITQQT